MHYFSLLLNAFLVIFITAIAQADQETLKIGWIGAMSGPLAKYGSYQSAVLAQEEINQAGGINGKKLELIFEDGQGSGLTSAKAAQKLIATDKVKYIIGGHCSPESLAIAPIAERNKVLMLAAITSNPKLTFAGDHVFRITAVSTKHADLLVPYAINDLGLKSFAVIHAETDYAIPPAEHFADLAKQMGAAVVAVHSYHEGETDFRAILTKLKTNMPEGIYIGVQSPESALVIAKQLRDLAVTSKLFGNEITGNAIALDPERAPLLDELIFGEPAFELKDEPTSSFVERYRKRFAVENLPYGIWSAEAYDAVQLLAKTIGRCGEDITAIKKCLLQTKDYQGVSGKISIDEHGDGVRQYELKKISHGKILKISR